MVVVMWRSFAKFRGHGGFMPGTCAARFLSQPPNTSKPPPNRSQITHFTPCFGGLSHSPPPTLANAAARIQPPRAGQPAQLAHSEKKRRIAPRRDRLHCPGRHSPLPIGRLNKDQRNAATPRSAAIRNFPGASQPFNLRRRGPFPTPSAFTNGSLDQPGLRACRQFSGAPLSGRQPPRRASRRVFRVIKQGPD